MKRLYAILMTRVVLDSFPRENFSKEKGKSHTYMYMIKLELYETKFSLHCQFEIILFFSMHIVFDAMQLTL